jgi:hypothetical protein
MALPVQARLPRRNGRRDPSRSGEARNCRQHLSGVIATMLLNDNQMARHAKAGGPISVILVDFVCGVAVIERTQPVRAPTLRPEDTTHPELTQWRVPPRQPLKCLSIGNCHKRQVLPGPQ